MKPTATKLRTALFGLFRNSLGKRLIFYVFSIYLLVAIVVTIVQLGLEFFRVRDTLQTDIAEISRTIYPSLSEQLWNLDNEGVRRSVQGVVEIEKVLGFQVFNETGSLIASKGLDKALSKNEANIPLKQSGIFDNFFGHQFDIHYVDIDDGQIYYVGHGRIFSGRKVVIDTLKYGFLLIIVNSLIKTTVLWFIIYFFIIRMVERPVNQLERENTLFDPDRPNLDESARKALIEGAKKPDQIGHLFQSYIDMRELIAHRLQQLQKLNENGQRLIEAPSVHEVISVAETILCDYFPLSRVLILYEADAGWYQQYPKTNLREPPQNIPSKLFKQAQEAGTIFEPDPETTANLAAIIPHNSVKKTGQNSPLLVFANALKNDQKRLIILHNLTASPNLTKADRLYIGNILQIFSSSLENVSLVETITNNNKRLETAITALEYSEHRFRDFAESSSDWFWEMDANFRYVYFSGKYEEITGLKIADRLGKLRTDFVDIQSQPSPQFWEDHKADLEAHRPFKNFEYALIMANGERINVSVSGVPVFDGNGVFTGYRGNSMSITQRKKLEEQLRRSQRMEAVGQLTGGIAHDFNNLLNIILGNAELLEDENIDADFAKQRTGEIIKTALRGAALTSRLLAFSRQQSLSPATVDISKLIDDLADLLKRTLGETIALEITHASNLWEATVDSHQFENALINLAINARDSMKQGGILTIETKNSTLDETYTEQHEDLAPGDYMTVAVSDTGTGMSADTLKNVFEPFFTTKDIGEGSGLGLSMVYGFSKQSGGHISIYSEEGHGTTVQLYLPRSLKNKISKTKNKTVQPKLLRGSESILIVEDDESLREIPVSFLKEYGYDVIEAANGEEAINHLNDGHNFDLLFTDIVLPGNMNGVDIATKAEQFQPGIKVLFATGYAENAVIQNGKLERGVNLINKPYSRSSLLELIRGILDGNTP